MNRVSSLLRDEWKADAIQDHVVTRSARCDFRSACWPGNDYLDTLGPDDLSEVARRRRKPNRIGYAVQLCYLRHPGRALSPDDAVSAAMLALLDDQIANIPTTSLAMSHVRQGHVSITRRSKRISVEGKFSYDGDGT